MGTMSTELGSSTLMLGSNARTALATSTAFEPARRNTATTTVAEGTRRPRTQNRMRIRSSCTLSRDRRDILQIDRRAVRLADDKLLVLRRLAQLALRLEQERPVRAVELPRAGIARAVLDRGIQIVDRQVARGHGGRIGLDAHRGLRAVNGHLAHARKEC